MRHTCLYDSNFLLFIHYIVSDSFVTPWTIAHHAPLSIEVSTQEYWNGLPFPSPEDLPDPGIKSMSLMSSALAAGFFTTSATWKSPVLGGKAFER